MRPGYLPVLLRKAHRRVVNTLRGGPDPTDIREWCRDAATAGGWQEWAADRDPELAREAMEYAGRLDGEARTILADAGVSFAGAGSYPLLYFLTRWRRPRVVVETGVAVGYTSRAVLDALDRNDRGRLYSSDFPYFRRRRPEDMIGLLVPGALRDRWKLYRRGDRTNLDRILRQIDQIDLFHYDSDKTYQGRRMAVEKIWPHMAGDSVLVMDDISDDGFFRDFVTDTKIEYDVLSFEGRYVGVVEL